MANSDEIRKKKVIANAAKWFIPKELAIQICDIYTKCVYCSKIFENKPRKIGDWEHINNDDRINNININNICLCCHECNLEKGIMEKSIKKENGGIFRANTPNDLRNWFNSDYCRERNISEGTVHKRL